jgi:TrpR-related protein YerC/YecD
MARREKKPHSNELYQAILSLQNEKECFEFFKDICSDTEMLTMEQRYHVAKLLEEGETYLTIQNTTNASTATISRVGRTLSDGTGVISEVLHRMNGND